MSEQESVDKVAIIEVWVKKYSDYLFTWALKKTQSKETAEDLVQETFITAFSTFEKFENRSEPGTWLTSILNNKVVDLFRKNSKLTLSSIQLEEKESSDFVDSFFDANEAWTSALIFSQWSEEENILDNAEFNKVLADCLDDLPAKWKVAVSAKYILEKDSREICQDLDMTPSNYWQIMHRAKLLLRKCIEIKWFS